MCSAPVGCFPDASPRIAQLILCDDLTIGGIYAMQLPTAGAEHRFVIIAIN
jgi:hypothetical protein